MDDPNDGGEHDAEQAAVTIGVSVSTAAIPDVPAATSEAPNGGTRVMETGSAGHEHVVEFNWTDNNDAVSQNFSSSLSPRQPGPRSYPVQLIKRSRAAEKPVVRPSTCRLHEGELPVRHHLQHHLLPRLFSHGVSVRGQQLRSS